MLIRDYQFHLNLSRSIAYDMQYFADLPYPDKKVSAESLYKNSDFPDYLLDGIKEVEVEFPKPLGVDEGTMLYLKMEEEMGLNRPDTKRYHGPRWSSELYCLSCFDEDKEKEVIYGSLFCTLPYYGAHVKLYKVQTEPLAQTEFTPKQSKIKRGEWALCPSYAEGYFDFTSSGAVLFSKECIIEEVNLGPVSGLLSLSGRVKVGESLFFDVSVQTGRWSVVDKKNNKAWSGDWGGWACALAALYGLSLPE